MTSYLGWPSYETWLCVLWLTNDESTYHDVRTLVRRSERPGQDLRDWVMEAVPVSPPSLYSDLLNHALTKIDWERVASTFLEEEIAS